MIRLIVASTLLAVPALGAETSFPVGAFDRVSLGGSPDVVVSTGKSVSVSATGAQRALDRLDIRVEGGVLKIGSKKGNWNWNWSNSGPIRIAVSVPMIRGVDLGGSGSIAVDRVKVPAFTANVGGSGAVRIANLDTASSNFALGGSGSITAAGRCAEARASIGGSGSLRLSGLKCATLAADIAGSGNLDAFASRTARISLAGSGDARIAGGAKCSVSKVGSGSVSCPA